MNSKLVFLLIVSIWVGVAGVPLFNKWNEAKQVSSVVRFRNQLFVLGRQCRSKAGYRSAPVEVSYAPVAVSVRVSSRTYQRRRRTLTGLSGGVLFSVLLIPLLGGFAVTLLILSLVATSLYVTLLVRSTHRREIPVLVPLPHMEMSRNYSHAEQLPA